MRSEGQSMAAPGNATPLLGLDAVAVDTETTGLDPAKARVVEIAALPLVRGQLDTAAPLRRLVQPGEPIPLAASRIHGIDDAAVANAPPFSAIAAEISRALDGAVLIGHSLGFDLAVLKREFAQAGVTWSPPRMLDTRLLAEIAAPGLADYSLDNLAAWLGVAIVKRHSALGDAEAAARIFLALLPRLRAVGIRTLAEAERACRAMTDALETQRRAGWVEPVAAPVEAALAAGSGRIDTYPYRHRVAEVMRTPAQFTAPDVPVSAALDRMTRERVSSLFVHAGVRGPPRPGETGIVTERDVMRALARHGAAALEQPVSALASRPLATVPADAFCYVAVSRMNRLGVRHLGVTGESGAVVGALSARDLLRLRGEVAISLGDELEQAAGAPELARAWAGLPLVAAALIEEQMSGRQIAAVVSRQVCALTARAAVLAEQRMRDAGLGGPPCPYAVAVLGSAGRGESLLALDQDNALVFAEGAPDSAEDNWFKQLGIHVADMLNEVGVPYCTGGVMARNAKWRGSVPTWRARVVNWIQRSNPQDLLSVDIFFDMLGVHGDSSLATALWHTAFDAAKGQVGFAKLLAESIGTIRPGLTMFGRFRTEQGRVDVKKSGLFAIVGAARALAVCHHLLERSTPARLAGIKALKLGGARDLDALAEAQATFLDLIVAQQVADIEQGIPPSNAVVVKRLSSHDRDRLRDALRSVEHLDQLTRDLLFKG
jgi:DNA polymerase-3 subunit epsilon/CBS domain-containing protein